MECHDPIVTVLQEQELLDTPTLQRVVDQHEKTGQTILSILRSDNLIDEDDYVRVVAASNHIEFISLAPEDIEPMVAHLVSYDIANHHSVIPVKCQGNQLMVAMSSPMNLMVRDQIEMKTGYQVVPLAATPTAIRQAIQFHFDVANVTKQAIASMRLKEDRVDDIHDDTELSARVSDDPITKLVGSIMRGAIDARASDIHIEPQERDVRVRYRVDGLLRGAVNIPASARQEVVSHIKIMANMDISEKRVPQDGHMPLRHCGRDYDLRISSLPSVVGEKIVVRILDKNVNKWDINKVVTHPQDNKEFRDLVANPYGMLLVTGPTGSGKTTTLYSLLQLVNTPERNIVTVEDPVEYRLDGITQVQINTAAGMTFASALRSILRQDPDIILIGEIRDLETAEIAISAALTGHLVLSTLHTNDASGAISRLINLGVPPFLVGSALLGAVAQRLVRISCPRCSQPYEPDERDLQLLFGPNIPPEMRTLQRGEGCNECHHSGYVGRKSIYEILRVSTQIRTMILEGRNGEEIKQVAMGDGMRTLYSSALAEVQSGVTTLEELMRTVDARGDA